MKQILFLLFLTLSTTTWANDSFSFELDKNQKFEATVSFALENATVHLLFVKNKDTKLYESIPFYMNSDQKIDKMQVASFEELPEIIGFHENGDLFSLLLFADESLHVLDYSKLKGNFNQKSFDSPDKPTVVFQQKNKTRFLTSENKGGTIKITSVFNSAEVSEKIFNVPTDIQKTVKDMLKESVDVIDNNHYVSNGSINTIQGYATGDYMYFTFYNNLKKDNPYVLAINSESGNMTQTQLEMPEIKRLLDFNAHIIDDKIFASFLEKDDFTFQIYNAQTGTTLKSQTLKETLSQLPTIKRKSATYLKEIKKLKHRSTVAVNETVDGKYAVTVDFVNIDTYTYNNWFWMHHFWFMNQMMMFNMGMPGFGPQEMLPEAFINYWGETKSVPLEFVLDSSLELLPNHDGATKNIEIDREKYGKQLAANKNLHNTSVGFLESEYRYIYTDKKEDVIYIKTKAIKRRDAPTRR